MPNTAGSLLSEDDLTRAVHAALESLENSRDGMAFTLQSMELDIKAVVREHDHGTSIRLPRPGERIDPTTLSILRFAFVLPGATGPAGAGSGA